MAQFNINIQDSGTIVNPNELKIYFGSVLNFPTTEVEIKNLNNVTLNTTEFFFELDNQLKKHVVALPFGINIVSVINTFNLQELITDQYEIINNLILIDNFQYKLYGLNNDVVYMNPTIHKFNITGTYTGN